jgi:hypothetical protein
LDGDLRRLGDIAEGYAGRAGDGTFDMLGFTIRSFELAPSEDILLLISKGIDGREFFLRELRPNWYEMTREQRATKIASFVRFANLLDRSERYPDGVDGAASAELAELRASVRTKIVLLATAYDETYGDSYGRRIARNPQRFGEYELTHA